jgi:hypothetical protein
VTIIFQIFRIAKLEAIKNSMNRNPEAFTFAMVSSTDKSNPLQNKLNNYEA